MPNICFLNPTWTSSTYWVMYWLKIRAKMDQADQCWLQRTVTLMCYLVLAPTSSKAQSSTWSLLSLLLGDQINPSIMPVNLFILSPKTANSLQPLCPRIISSILHNPNRNSWNHKNEIMSAKVAPLTTKP